MTFIPITPDLISPTRWEEVLAAPISDVPELPAVVVTDGDLIRQILRDDEGFTSAIAALARPSLRRLAKEFPETFAHYRSSRSQQSGYTPALIQADGQTHARHRAILAEWFSAARVAGLGPTLAELASRQWMIAASQPQPIDVRREFAEPFSLAVLTHALGVPLKDAEQLGQWSHHVFSLRRQWPTRDEYENGASARQAVHEYFREQLAAPTTSTAPSLVEAFREELRASGQPNPPHVALDILQQLLVAGNESLAATFPGILALILSPAWADWGSRDLDELTTLGLRLCHSSRAIARLATRRTLVGDITIEPNRIVWLHLEAANMTDESDVTRGSTSRHRPHLAFGYGTHRCVGAQLATAEIRAGLQALATDFPSARRIRVDWPDEYDLALRVPDRDLVDLSGAAASGTPRS